MNNSAIDGSLRGRVFLVLELLHLPTTSAAGVSLVLSVPGREGTLTRRWKAPYGILDSHQVDDLVAVVGKSVTDGLVAFTGVQLPLDR